METKEILKAQIAIPSRRPRKPTPEGLHPHPREPQGQLELRAYGPPNGGDTINDGRGATHSRSWAVRSGPTECRRTAGLSRFAIPKTGTEAREAEEAAQVHALSG